MPSLKTILRTCVFCREKNEQKTLLRFKCVEKKLSLYDNFGRSFYVCKPCAIKIQENTNEKTYKKYEKSLCRECKNKDEYVIQLKEILTDVR